MDLEQVLLEIRELLAKRDEIDERLSQLITAGPRPLTVRDRQAEKPNGGRGRPASNRRCGQCGGKGHTARTCGKAAGSEERRPEHIEDPLTEDQYDEVRARKNAGDSSYEVAEALGFSQKHVNIAFSASTYERYQMIAERE